MTSRVSPFDYVFFSFDTPATHQAIASFCILDGIPDLNEFRKRVNHLVETYPRLAMRVSHRGRPRWIADNNFTIDRHLVVECHHDIVTEEELLGAVDNAFSTRLDLEQPLWRFTVITNSMIAGEREGARCAVLFTIHHALADGLGGLELLENMWSDDDQIATSSGLTETPQQRNSRDLPVKQWPSILRSESFPIKKTSSVFRWLSESFSPLARGPLNGPNSPMRRIAITQLDVSVLKAIKTQTGVAFNDLLLTLVAGAIRRFYSLNEFPLRDVRVLIPISVRSVTQRKNLGNRISGVGVRLPVRSSSALEQLKIIHRGFQKLRRSGALGAYIVVGSVVTRLPRSLQRRFCRIQARRTNFICTSVLVSDTPKYLCGVRIRENYGLAALMHGHGVAFGFLTYAGKVCVSIVSDKAIVANPWLLVRCVEESVDALVEEAGIASNVPQDSKGYGA